MADVLFLSWNSSWQVLVWVATLWLVLVRQLLSHHFTLIRVIARNADAHTKTLCVYSYLCIAQTWSKVVKAFRQGFLQIKNQLFFFVIKLRLSRYAIIASSCLFGHIKKHVSSDCRYTTPSSASHSLRYFQLCKCHLLLVGELLLLWSGTVIALGWWWSEIPTDLPFHSSCNPRLRHHIACWIFIFVTQRWSDAR